MAPSSILAKALQPGDTIAFVSLSARLNDIFPDTLARATSLFQSHGYKVRVLFTSRQDPDVQCGIADRLGELREAMLDPDIAAVVCTIGGETFTELLPALVVDAALHAQVRANPKVVVGYSDNTGLHWLLHTLTGLRTFYGPTAIPELGTADVRDDQESPLTFCVNALFKAVTKAEPLGAVVRLNGVHAIAPDWRDRIVFLETAVSEADDLGAVRTAFADLIAQGVFDAAAGLVVGRPFGYDSKEAREEYAQVITSLLCDTHHGPLAGNRFPILFNVDIGHTTPMVTLPIGALAVLDSETDEFAILEAGVESA
ncbi:peptidase u61 ld-carboxypeptidase a [Akanthomyces lecanii RCEF 1005]|uniref:Peptidase u61 ld-carboxypeptidase a n=1 Tax=Akanthomyces lecanii RCEF 1005 TaxID=1081108 RepID=A0A162KBB7_CORDF|nr:peptidase u61 ld-carboxypeptidase a [Akanthomyces lecanii RCEF 1005]